MSTNELATMLSVVGGPGLIGSHIGFDALLNECLAARRGRNSLIDNHAFQSSIIEAGDRAKISLLATFCHPASVLIEQQFLAQDYFAFFACNQRVFHDDRHRLRWAEIISADLHSGEPDDIGEITRALARNPAYDRKFLADIIAGRSSGVDASFIQRFKIGRESVRAVYIDDSFVGQDMPTRNELNFEKPCEELFLIAIRFLDGQHPDLSQGFAEELWYSIAPLWNRWVFEPWTWRKAVKTVGHKTKVDATGVEDYHQHGSEISLATLSWVAEKAEGVNALARSRAEAAQGLLLAFIAFQVLRRFSDSLPIHETARTSYAWPLRAAYFACIYEGFVEKVRDFDLTNENYLRGKVDREWFFETHKKISQEIDEVGLDDADVVLRSQDLIPWQCEPSHELARQLAWKLDEKFVPGLNPLVGNAEIFGYFRLRSSDRINFASKFDVRFRPKTDKPVEERLSDIERQFNFERNEARIFREWLRSRLDHATLAAIAIFVGLLLGIFSTRN